jgi:hypothetical protein
MIWMAWRQFRTAAVVVFGALAVVAVVVIVTGISLHDAARSVPGVSCDGADFCTAPLAQMFTWVQGLLGVQLMLFFPAVLGVFWAAPLVSREFDTGTFRLAWTQSVTRVRWLTAKILVVGLASVIATGLLSWMVTWWFTPLDHIAQGKFDVSVFGERDIAPVGYAAFAFALGLTLGLLIRRTLPAMAATLVGYVAARAVVMNWVRPHFQAPLQQAYGLPGTQFATGAGSWVISSYFTDPSGQPVTGNLHLTPGDPCIAAHRCYIQVITFQPANRYWPFQWYETGLFVGAALLLIGFCYWWITGHRLPWARRREGGSAAPAGTSTGPSGTAAAPPAGPELVSPPAMSSPGSVSDAVP